MSSFGEGLSFGLSGTDDCGPNYTNGKYLFKGESGEFPRNREEAHSRTRGVNGGCLNHDYNYGRMSHAAADKLLVSELLSGKFLKPADYGGSGYYDFLRQVALGATFYLKSFGSADPVPENVQYPWEGLKNSNEEPDMTKNKKGKTPNANPPSKKGKKKIEKAPKPSKRPLPKAIKEVKKEVKHVEQKVSAAPMMKRIDHSIKRRINAQGRVVVEAALPLGPVQMSGATKYLDVLQTVRVNPFLFPDTSIYAEAKVHEQYKVKHRLVYQSAGSSQLGGVIAWGYDPDPKDDISLQVTQGQDLQNAWKGSCSTFQEQIVPSKVVTSPLLWTNNKSQGLNLARDELSDSRLTKSGTWYVYCRVPPNSGGDSVIIGEFVLLAEFEFFKVANEGMWSYGISVMSNDVNSSVLPFFDSTDSAFNTELNQFLLGDQIDQDHGVTGFHLFNVVTDPAPDRYGWTTCQAGNWIMYVIAQQTSLTTATYAHHTFNFDVSMVLYESTPESDRLLYVAVVLLQNRARRPTEEDFSYYYIQASANPNWEFCHTAVYPLNQDTFQVLRERGLWTSEPGAKKETKHKLPRLKSGGTETVFTMEKSGVKKVAAPPPVRKVEHVSDVGRSSGKLVPGTSAWLLDAMPDDGHELNTTGSGKEIIEEFGTKEEAAKAFTKLTKKLEKLREEKANSPEYAEFLKERIKFVNDQLRRISKLEFTAPEKKKALVKQISDMGSDYAAAVTSSPTNS